MKHAAWWICITSCNTNGLRSRVQIRAINQGADEPETTNVLSFSIAKLKRWKIKSAPRWANTRKSLLPGVGRKASSALGL